MPLESAPEIDQLLATPKGRTALQNLVNLEKLGNTIDRVFGVDAAGARSNQGDYKSRTERAVDHERSVATGRGIGAVFAGGVSALSGVGMANTILNSTGDTSVAPYGAIIGESLGIAGGAVGAAALVVSAAASSRVAKLAQQYAALSDETRASIVDAGMSGSVYEPNGLESYLEMVHENFDAAVTGLGSKAPSVEVTTPGI